MQQNGKKPQKKLFKKFPSGVSGRGAAAEQPSSFVYMLAKKKTIKSRFKRSVFLTGAVDRDDRAKLPGHPGLVSEPEMQGA